jgi:hypothetical protein
MKKLILVSYGLLILPNLYAQNLRAENSSGVARGVAANVEGKVELVDVDSEESQTLEAKEIIREKDGVNVGESSQATLVFSNGATIILDQNSSLVISEFLQNPFDTPFGIAAQAEEPSVSTMKLELEKGDVICDAKKLRVDEGSSLTINTPVGAAGIRGTRFQVTYVPGNPGTYTLSVTKGSVTFKNDKGEEDIVEAGTEIVITFTTEEGPNGVVVTITGRKEGRIPQARIDEINRKAEEAKEFVDNTVFPPDNDVLELRSELAKALEDVIETVNETPVTTDPNP